MTTEALKMSSQEVRQLQQEVGAYNLANSFKREPLKEGLGRDQFLKLLTVQMSHQDPLAPMDNRDMIAQLAQFSSLEQMTQVNKSLESMSSFYSGQNAYSMLGRSVEFVDDTGNRFLGPVEMVMQNENGVALAVRTNKGVINVSPADIMIVHSDGNLMATESAEEIASKKLVENAEPTATIE